MLQRRKRVCDFFSPDSKVSRKPISDRGSDMKIVITSKDYSGCPPPPPQKKKKGGGGAERSIFVTLVFENIAYFDVIIPTSLKLVE